MRSESGLARRLRELRQEHGLSQEDVARLAGVQGKAVVANWETMTARRRTPDLQVLIKLARWYGVTLDYLVGLPGAEKDTLGVRIGKDALSRRFLRAVGERLYLTPAQRIGIAYTILHEEAPDAYYDERMAFLLRVGVDRFRRLLQGEQASESDIALFAKVVDMPVDWLYGVNPGVQPGETQRKWSGAPTLNDGRDACGH